MTKTLACSIVIPCRNEVRHIGRCLDSIFANQFPEQDYEVIVADGLSDDGTRELLAGFAEAHRNLRMLDNPSRSTPAALNLAIRASTGRIILRIDAHAIVDRLYIASCIAVSEATGADNVGGVMHTHPMHDGPFSEAIAIALSHPLGVGNSAFRVSAKAQSVDTVFGGCYRREVFDRIGLYNERLLRGQDMELNRRLVKAGGRILLDPSIVSHYYARSAFLSFCRHNWSNGVWAILPFLHSQVMPVRWRHLVPLAFVLGLIVTAGAVLLGSALAWPGVAAFAVYIAACVAASAREAMRRRQFRLLFQLPIVFLALHLCYGAGSIWGVILAATSVQSWHSAPAIPRL